MTEERVLEAPRDPIVSIRWGLYAFSILFPYAGICVALFLYDQDSREARRVGRNCLLLSFLLWVLFPVLLLVGILALGVLAVLGAVSNLAPLD